MPLDQVIIATVIILLIAFALVSAIILAIIYVFDDPFQSRMIFVTILSTAWIFVVFIACVCKAYSAGEFDNEEKSEPQTEASTPKLDYEKN